MNITYVSTNGERVIESSLGAFSGSDQSSLVDTYESARTAAGGWEVAPVNSPEGYVNAGASSLLAASPTLDSGLFEYKLSATGDSRNTAFYVTALPSGQPEKVGPRISPAALEDNPTTETLNSSEPSPSDDLSHVLFMLTGPEFSNSIKLEYLWPGDETALNPNPTARGFSSLYEYVGRNNSIPSLVGVTNSTGRLIGQCGTSLGFPEEGSATSLQLEDAYNTISAPTGSRIFFTVFAGPEKGAYPDHTRCGLGVGPPANELYAREEPTSGSSRIVKISEPTTGPEGACAECDTSAPANAAFQGASEDGSKVFFLSEQHLLAAAEGQSLYMYNFNTAKGDHLVFVAPNVLGVSRISEDGSHVYFVTRSKVTNTPNPVGSVAEVGGNNLYVYNTDNRETAFIGALSEEDGRDWQQRDSRPVDATPDGSRLVFSSSADLTPGDTSSLKQVFEYDAQAKTLIQISRGSNDFGGEFSSEIVYPNYTGNVNPAPQPSSISNNGAEVVFQSDAALTPAAAAGYSNIYEYHDGLVSLISDGQDRSIEQGASTRLMGIDGSGSDIFFTSADQLVPQDGDTQADAYDARMGGGLLPVSPAACEGDGCQGMLAPSPMITSAVSVSQPAGEQVVEQSTKMKSKTKNKKHRRKAKKRLHNAGKVAQRRKRR